MTTLLDEVIEAHGGRRRWGKASEIRAHARTGGLLMASKLKSRDHFSDYGLSVATDRQNMVLQPYPRAGRTGVFDQGTVRILGSDGAVISERENARDAFFGLSGIGRKAWWSDLDALYFGGYAMWNYLNTPFMFEGEGFEVSEGEPLEAEGETWRCLDVTFPEDFETHSREQRFYFDDQLMLRRNDYTAEVISSLAKGCHFTYDHRTFDGLVFPTRRRVQLRGPGGRALPGVSVVTIELASIAVD